MNQTTDIQEVEELSLEKVIETKLVQNNVTEQVLAELKSRYGGLKLKAIDDKESYLELKDAAKNCAKVRNLTTTVCKEGREEAVRTQKKWVAEEKRVIAIIKEVEEPLDNEIAKYDAEIDRKAAEEKERQEEAYINRQAILTKMGATYSAGSFVLGDASFESELIKSSSDDIWEEAIVPKFKEEYEKIEMVRIAEQKKKDEAESELKRQQDELKKQQEELRAAQDEMQKQKRDAELLALAEKEKVRERRNVELRPYVVFIRDYNSVLNMDEASYQKELLDIKTGAEQQWEQDKKDVEAKRLKEIEDAKLQAIEDEKKRLADIEIKRQTDLEASKDKDKWEAFLHDVREVEIFEMRSGQYRRKMQIAREKIEEILSL